MSNLDYTKTGFCTAAVHAGYIRDKEWGAEATPIYQTSTYTFETLEEGGGVFSGTVPKYPYARTANPTVATFERKMCALEHANAAVATGSGMGAVSSALLGVLQAGDHIVCSDTVYGCTDVVMRSILPSLGFETTLVDTSDPEAVKAAMKPNTKILYFEVAANPTMRVTDIAEMVKIGHEGGAKVIVDNTFTPPPVCTPLDFGVDIVLHSVTKYLNGHGDVIAGVICSKDEELIHTIKSRAVGKMTGSSMAPMMPTLISLRIVALLAFLAVEQCRVGEVRVVDYLQRVGEVAPCPPVRQVEVGVVPVAAGLGASAGDLSLEVAYELEAATYERQHLVRAALAKHHQVEARTAAHGAKVDHAAGPLGVVSQEGGPQVLDGVDRGRVHDGLAVGRREAQVKGGDHGTGIGVLVHAAHVDARLEHEVVHGEACDCLHGVTAFQLVASLIIDALVSADAGRAIHGAREMARTSASACTA